MKYPNKAHVPRSSRSWDAVAHWYVGWAGTHGSRHHKALAIPLALELLIFGRARHLSISAAVRASWPRLSRKRARR